MNTCTRFENGIHDQQDLLELQLKIARRADELSATRCSSHEDIDDWFCWIEAEREVMGAANRAPSKAADAATPAHCGWTSIFAA